MRGKETPVVFSALGRLLFVSAKKAPGINPGDSGLKTDSLSRTGKASNR